MSIEIKVPVFPESVTEGTLTAWHKRPGDRVSHGEVIADIETDKVVFEVPSMVDGVVEAILVDEGVTVHANDVVARIDETLLPDTGANDAVAEPVTSAEILLSPAAERLIEENKLDASSIQGTGKNGQVLKEDVLAYLEKAGGKSSNVTTLKQPDEKQPASPSVTAMPSGERPQKRVPMSRLRARIAERLVEAQRTAAILTTFNEVNMQPLMELRTQYRELFEKKHGVRLGFMSMFVMAAVEALKEFPEVNASIEHDDIVYHGFFDIGIAVGSPRGLVVPVLRDADTLSVADIEKKINDYGQRAQSGSLSIEEITGGTFSITNGGVFGSLFSTPILNPPQSGILGMHKIEERPVVVNGEIVIRPMMYLAFSYDHRIIDGREAVQFLVKIKNIIEDPSRLLLGV